MNTTTTTPNIEQVKAKEMSVQLNCNMTLAMIPVTVSGQYNVHSNCFYPSMVQVNMALPDEDIQEGQMLTMEDLCTTFEWDPYQTYDDIQEAVEKRDQ